MNSRVKLIISSNVNDYIDLIHRLRSLGIFVDACEFEDPLDDPDMQKFIAECASHCKCDGTYSPCAGVLAGGFCDNLQFNEDYDDLDDDFYDAQDDEI